MSAAVAVAVLLVVLVPGAAVAQVPDGVTADGAVLYDPGEQAVLAGRDEATPRLIASTTKVMTALLAVEAGTIDETVTVSANAVATGATPGAARLELVAGEQIVMRDLLAGLVIRSGNDAAVAIAEHVDGTVPAFVARMNARAAQLGMADTSFVEPHGLTVDPGNRSSPLDLARLAAVAMADPDFAAWAGAPALDVPGLPQLPNRNELIGRYEGATGVKTGYLGLAGMCLIATATRGERSFTAVVLNSDASFADAAVLLDHGFEDHRRVAPAEPGAPVVAYRWAGAEVALVAETALDETLPAGIEATWRTLLAPDLARPAAAGTVAGRAELLVAGEVTEVVELRLGAAVPEPAPAEPAVRAGGAVQEALRAFARSVPIDRAA